MGAILAVLLSLGNLGLGGLAQDEAPVVPIGGGTIGSGTPHCGIQCIGDPPPPPQKPRG